MILACGEALIDMMPRTTTQGEPAFAPYAGGAVFNTAIALGRLGVPCGFFSGLSTDMMGDILIDTLAASGVDTSLCVRSDRPTTIAFVKLRNGEASYAFYDENTAGRLLEATDLPTLPDTVKTLFFGGISLINDPAASTYEALQARHFATRVTMIDPNIRPGFIGGRETEYRLRMDRMMRRADIVKLSDADLHWLMGTGDMESLARRIIAQGPKVVVITAGASGSHAITATRTLHAEAWPVTCVDTVGAGDTFNAGLLAALHATGALTKSAIGALPDATLQAALTLGNRAAAITVGRAGANPPWAHEL